MAKPVFLMHDGAIDELICIPFLLSMQGIELSTVWITPADCLGRPTAIACQQMLAFAGAPNVGLFLSDSSSERPFPWTYRQYAMVVNLLPLLQPPSNASLPKATRIRTRLQAADQARIIHARIKQQNDRQGEATVMLVTCPLTDLAWLLDANPATQDEIASLTWMGGTISAPGNIDTGIAIGANPNAEWNAYWDPFAVDAIFRSGMSINLFPLDVTNQFYLTPSVLETYFIPSSGSSKMINLACQMYAMVAFQAGYSFWDTAAAASIGNGSLFTTTAKTLAINTDEENDAAFGCITEGETGSSVNVATFAGDVSSFYGYLTKQLSSTL